MNPIPKPNYRQERKRKQRAIKKADKEFQSDMPDRPICVCGHAINKNQAAKHHAIHSRKYMEYRYDDNNCVILCYRHHTEIHSKGEVWFYLNYGRSIRRYDRIFFEYLRQKYVESVL